MDLLITVIAFLVIFSLLVLIHEWGHFFTARKAGIKVEEFGFGLPPRIWGVKKGETLYSINWIPFGGFVRLLGEDSRDPKLAKDKRSFIAKPPRVRIMVIVAGVVMNFLLAYVLLTVGFIIGIKPLILSGDDVIARLNDGTIETSPGFVVKDVTQDGPAAKAGMLVNDKVVAVDQKPVVSNEELTNLLKSQNDTGHTVSVERGTDRLDLTVAADQKQGLGFSTFEIMFLPRVEILNVKENSASAMAGLLPSDIILKINDQPIYYLDEYLNAIRSSGTLNFMVQRGNEIRNVQVRMIQAPSVIMSGVFPGTPAEKAGVAKGDLLISIDGQTFSTPDEVIAYTKQKANKVLHYVFDRQGQLVEFDITPSEQGLIGVGLSPVFSFENQELSVYTTDSPVSVLLIHDVQYTFWVAPFRAFEEAGRLSVLTAQMFGNVIHQVVTQFSVPEGVAGPVGIAQLTYQFVQEGAMSLLRFVALLSLSLAIINILPLPALDGGRLLFIVIEVITGKRVSAKLEGLIHAVGFLLLITLIFAVTYNDILRLIPR
ncbi:RIP metalloprotease RseP [Candidatus Peregrinibacteria bacterium]|nr:RIP metalloprotease RseP [Candidatus Peregrinibacteria bacterium]